MAKVLVIDDDAGLRATVGEMLALLGHQAVEAADGRKGIEAAEADPPDLVICDIFMPDCEGLATIRELRRTREDLPILAISGRDSFYLKIAERLGAGAGLSKPFGIDQLGHWVNGLLYGAHGLP
jgi:DNA-binding response OmpR family regulator